MTRKILIVDDEESIRITFSAFLNKEGHETVTADTFERAMETLYSEEFDLIFIDIFLSDQSGVNILKNIKARGSTCPVIMITGDPNIVTAADALRLGAFDYLIKPIRRESLIRVTNHALQHKSLIEEKQRIEKENKRYRANLEAIFRSVADAIITIDNDQEVLEANQAAQDLFGFNPKGMRWQQFAQEQDPLLQACYKIMQQTITSRSSIQEYRVECSRPQNPDQVVVLNSAPLKDINDQQVGSVLVVRDITRLTSLEKELMDRSQFHNIIGNSPRMQEIFRLMENLKDTDTTALITGESGTGKELVAKALHYAGYRSHMPFVAVNCSSLAENLLESELFGHVKGSFTGAIRDKVGRFQLADQGTIFLDEIGDISPRIQLKLLRVLEEKEFERVGDNMPIKVNARVIAATNRNLKEMVREGTFRGDLYYRLKVVEIYLPSLRQRTSDIPLIISHYIDTFNRRFKKQIRGLNDAAERAMMEYRWPGNIRELQHAIEHAFVICQDDTIRPEDLPAELREQCPPAAATPHNELDELVDALQKAGGNKAKAARMLGISRQTMYRRIIKHDLEKHCESM